MVLKTRAEVMLAEADAMQREAATLRMRAIREMEEAEMKCSAATAEPPSCIHNSLGSLEEAQHRNADRIRGAKQLLGIDELPEGIAGAMCSPSGGALDAVMRRIDDATHYAQSQGAELDRIIAALRKIEG